MSSKKPRNLMTSQEQPQEAPPVPFIPDEPVPFPTQTGPRQVGGESENVQQIAPASNGRLAHAAHVAQQQVQHLPAPELQPMLHESNEVRMRLAQLQVGANTGLFVLADQISYDVGQYQAHYLAKTGQAITFHEALGQVVTLLGLVAD